MKSLEDFKNPSPAQDPIRNLAKEMIRMKVRYNGKPMDFWQLTRQLLQQAQAISNEKNNIKLDPASQEAIHRLEQQMQRIMRQNSFEAEPLKYAETFIAETQAGAQKIIDLYAQILDENPAPFDDDQSAFASKVRGMRASTEISLQQKVDLIADLNAVSEKAKALSATIPAQRVRR